MLNIKVLGIGGTKYFNLVENLNEAIKQLDFKVQIEYLREVEDFIKYEILEIPTLIINESIITKEHNLTVKEILKQLIGIYETMLIEANSG